MSRLHGIGEGSKGPRGCMRALQGQSAQAGCSGVTLRGLPSAENAAAHRPRGSFTCVAAAPCPHCLHNSPPACDLRRWSRLEKDQRAAGRWEPPRSVCCSVGRAPVHRRTAASHRVNLAVGALAKQGDNLIFLHRRWVHHPLKATVDRHTRREAQRSGGTAG